MEPVTLSLIVAALVAKGLDRTEDRAVDQASSAIARLLARVRTKLSSGSADDKLALAGVEETPDSTKRIRALGAALQRHTIGDEPFATELQRLVSEVQNEGVNVDSVVQTAIGDNNVNIAHVSGSNISVERGT